jgi:hypothetical protein
MGQLAVWYGFQSEQCSWEWVGHASRVMFGGMKLERCFENRRRSVVHFKGGIVLSVPIVRIMLAQHDSENLRNFEDIFLGVEFPQIDCHFYGEAVGRVRRRRNFSARDLRCECALRRVRRVEQPEDGQQLDHMESPVCKIGCALRTTKMDRTLRKAPGDWRTPRPGGEFEIHRELGVIWLVAD